MLDPSSPSGSCPSANPLPDCDGWEVSLLGSGYDSFYDRTFLTYSVTQGDGVVLDSVTISSGSCCVEDASYFGDSLGYGLDSDSCVNGVNYIKTLTQNTGYYKIVYTGNVPVVNNATTVAVKNGNGFCLYKVPGVDCSTPTPPPPPPLTSPPPPPPVVTHTMVLRQPLDIEIRERAVRDSFRQNIVVRRNSNKGEVRALIKFPEISNIPSGAIITSAELRFFTKNPTEATEDIISGYIVNADWDNYSNWGTVSGGVDLTTTPQISFAFMPSTDEKDIFVDVDPAEIQAWLDGTVPNDGWVMVSDSDGKSSRKQPMHHIVGFPLTDRASL